MKVVKWILLALIAYVFINRPSLVDLVDSQSHVSASDAFPDHVKTLLGTQSDTAFKGIDLSHFNGEVDFNTLLSHVDFVYLKATQGTDYVDPTYQSHNQQLNEIKADGSASFHTGAYHYFAPDEDAKAQALHFVSTVRDSGHTLPPALDVEVTQNTSSDDIKKGIKEWLDTVQQALGCKPIFYTYGDFWSENIGEQFNDYGAWLADYADKPTVPAAMKDWRIWQYTDKGTLPGVQNQVDLNVLVKDGLTCHG